MVYETRGILFDLDGVLVDAASWHEEAFLEAVRAFGGNLSKEEHSSTYNGLSTMVKIEKLIEAKKLPSTTVPNLLYTRKQRNTINIIGEKCFPIERVKDTIEHARLHFDGKIGVVTNCSRLTANLMLQGSELHGLFATMVCNNDLGGYIKPHPRPYLMGAKDLGLKNEEVLAIDDTLFGITSALDAQCKVWHLKDFEDLTVYNLIEKLKKTDTL